MKNRLRMHWRVVLGLSSLFFWITLPSLHAQQGFFNFSYPGPNTIIVSPSNCSNTLAGNIGTPVVTSTVGATITLSQFDPLLSGFQLSDPWTYNETAELYWSVADNQGHTATFTFFVSFVDTTKPVINTMGLPPTVTYPSISKVPLPPNLTATDPCDDPPMQITFTQSPPPLLCQGGVFTRTWVAMDDSGNSSAFTQTITILIDTVPPTVTANPQNGSAQCTQVATAYPAWLAAQMANFQATDPSGIASKTNNGPPAITGSCPPPLTVTFTVTDSCGYSRTRTATFTTIDTKGPDVLRAPQDSLAACSPSTDNHLAVLSDWIYRRAGLIAKDSCTPDNGILYTMRVNSMVLDSAQIMAAFLDSMAVGACGPMQIGTQTIPKVRARIGIDFFARDACNNLTLLGHARFGAIDTVPPALIGAMYSEECGGGNDSTILKTWINNHGNISVTDDCSGYSWTDFSWLTSTGQSGTGLFGSGPYPAIVPNDCDWYVDIAFHATDICGNTGSTTLRFELTDTTNPVFSALAPDTLYCPNTTPPVPTAFVTDNCDATVAISSNFQQINPVCPNNYTLLYTWIATDDCGNTATATQTFFVRDTTRPVIILIPADLTIRCDTFSLPPAPVLGQDVQATDICGDVVDLAFTDNSGQNPDPGLCGHYTYDIVRVFTVTDDCGNSSTAQQIIHVVDNIPPTFDGFTDTTLVCDVQPITPPPAVSDICSGIATGPVLENDIITGGDCSDSYTRTLSWSSTDICGNTSYFTQNINVVDTLSPTLSGVPADLLVECNNVPPPPPLSAITGADNCDEDVDITFVETALRDPNPANCAHWTNYAIRREWTASDNCGNSRTYTQMITVQDNTGPIITALDTVKTPNAPGLCGANTVIPSLISVFDDCTSLPDTITLRDTVVLTPSGTPIDQVPVDTVIFSWAAPNAPPGTPVVGTATLAIALDNADSELPSETFQVYGEDGYLIGRTKLTNVSCGFSGDTIFTLPANLINSWLTDGQLNIILAPNGSGSAACNAFCPGGRARARLSYAVATPQLPLTIEYAIDSGAYQAYPPAGSVFLDAGNHTITYRAADCAGNSRTAITIVRIEDLEPPAVTAPAPITAYVSTTNCTASVSLPFPALQENCSFTANIAKSSGVTPVQFEQDPNAGWVPKNAILNVSGLVPNAVAGGVLRIRHKGDNDEPGEFFRVLDEQGVFLSTTTIATSGACMTVHETVIPVTANQINSWATNGVGSFLLQANRDVVNYFEHISFCAPLNAGNFDGVSTLEAVLEYNYAVVDYVIKKGNQPVQSGQLNDSQTNVSLSPGNYTAQYSVSDNSGNIGTASFPVTILDTVAPKALCQPITIFTNPSGTVNYTLLPQQINAGSTDNCSGTNVTFQLSQTTFTCSMATPPNNIYPVTLTVADTAGNSATCTTTVQVQTVSASPTVTPSVCEGGDIQLFANPPAPIPPSGYTYMWTGPNGFVSNQPNPIIFSTTSANEGTYTVKITGPTLCMSTGNVLVDLTNLPNQPAFQNVPSLICQGATLTLTVQQFAGNVVTYSWYSGTPANPTLLGTTSIPMIQLPGLPAGPYQFYVKVAADGCTSLPSDVINVTVQQRPTATVDNANISVCTCETITLGTPVQGPGITYSWTGPGFSTPATSQYPLVTTCAQSAVHGGNYTLVISENGCASTPATVQVQVRPKPPKPAISGVTAVCKGDTVQLICNNVPTASQYRWITPQTSEIITTINTLLIPNTSAADSGLWRLQVIQNNCISDLSDPKLVQVQAFPNISATSNSPICQGATLNLNANSTTQGVTYEWSGPNGFGGIGANVSTNMPATGNYRVTVSTGFGCTNVAVAPVTVIIPPEITSVTNTAPACVDCATDAVLQATIFTQNGPLMYTWTGPPGFSSSLPQPVIPKVCTSNNGTYNLVVKDASGCVSNQGSTTINVKAQPERPLVGSNQQLCIGSPLNISVQNANMYGSNILFEWHTPNGIITQATSKLTIPITGLQHNGDYFLIAKNGDCLSAASEIVTVTVHPVPPAPAVSSNSPVCTGDTLRLYASAIPGATYSWTGPTFSSGVQNPTIPQADKATHEGCYKVTATVNGCVSPNSENVCVEVRARPTAPTILPIAPACLNQAGASLTLKVAPATATSGAQYVWYNYTDKSPLGPPGFPLNFTLTDLSGLAPGANQFSVRAILNGCPSTESLPVSVNLDTIPNMTAYAGMDMPACDAFPFWLRATKPLPTGIATGIWTQISGPPVTIVNPMQDSSQVVGSIAGNLYKYVWTLSNGACKNFSRDTVQISVNAFENAQVVNDLIILCFSDSVQLQAIQGTNVPGFWTQPDGQTKFIPPITFDNKNDPNTFVRNLPDNANNLFFYWNLQVAGCPVDSAKVTVRTIERIPFAGQDQNLCITDSCALLTATSLEPFETGKWFYLDSLVNPALKINSPKQPTTITCDLQFGPNRFVWETNAGICGNRSRDTVVVYYDLEPTAYEDSITVDFGQQVQYNVLLNDIVPPQFTIRVLEAPKQGTWTEPTKGTFSYLPSLTFSGRDKIIYELCNLNPACPCSMATLFLDVQEAGECRIPTIITPNGDGANDIFVIPFYCLSNGEEGPQNEVTIFNQWGDQVFHAKPYNNDWGGTYNGEDLPAGTYFFVVKLPAENTQRTGFLIIQR